MLKKFFLTVLLLPCLSTMAQHRVRMLVEADEKRHVLGVKQEIVFVNTSSRPLSGVVLNDWNNSFSSKATPLAHRFSDEFVRAFHLAKDHERGSTSNISILDGDQRFLQWRRPQGKPDILEVDFREELAAGDSIKLNLTYFLKVPSDRFTKFGYTDNGGFLLRDAFLMPARLDNGKFARYSNENLDDRATGAVDIAHSVVSCTAVADAGAGSSTIPVHTAKGTSRKPSVMTSARVIAIGRRR